MVIPSSIAISVPSKTFVLGEYLAMTDGLGFIINSPPYFHFFCGANLKLAERKPSLCSKFISSTIRSNSTYGNLIKFIILEEVFAKIERDKVSFNLKLWSIYNLLVEKISFIQGQLIQADTKFSYFHVQSPAGRYIKCHEDIFETDYLNYVFFDPHKGLGGFGASGAQFISVILVKNILEALNSNLNYNKWFSSLLNDQKKFFSHFRVLIDHYIGAGNGMSRLRPSGLDVFAQIRGGLCVLDLKSDFCHSGEWGFPEVNFVLIRTGNKVATHEHISNLRIEQIPSTELKKIWYDFIEAYNKKDFSICYNLINRYYDCLLRNNLILESSHKIVSDLRVLPGVVVAKSCGALGADIVLLFVYKDQWMRFLDALRVTSYYARVVYWGDSMADGARFSVID